MFGPNPEVTRERVSEVERGEWIPILDYAVMKGISTSTLRRYIKTKKIQYKIENGRYLLLADHATAASIRLRTEPVRITPPQWDGASGSADRGLYSRVHDLEQQLRSAHEQIGELKMLVAIYEEKLVQLDQ